MIYTRLLMLTSLVDVYEQSVLNDLVNCIVKKNVNE